MIFQNVKPVFNSNFRNCLLAALLRATAVHIVEIREQKGHFEI